MGKVHPLQTLVTKMETRLDGWASKLTGIGTSRDKRESYFFKPTAPLPYQKAEELYNGNDLAARICEIFPEDATSGGVLVRVTDNPEKKTALAKRLNELGALRAVTDGGVWGRVHGDALLYIATDDGAPLDKPLDLDAVTQVRFLKLRQRGRFTVARRYTDPNEANYEQPELYWFVGSGGSTLVHESRCAKFRGARTSETQFIARGGYHFSVLDRVQAVLRDFGITWASAALLMSNSTQGVYKFEDFLKSVLSEDGSDTLAKRVQAMDMIRSVSNSVAMDVKESFTYETAQLTGASDIMDKFAQRLSAATGIPVTVLMGESPAGLNATGASDLKLWFQKVFVYQRDEMAPAIELVLKCLTKELQIPEDKWSFQFGPALQMTQQEEAALRNLVAQTDQIYITNSVYTSEETALSRFSPEGWSMETSVNLDLRRSITESMTEDDLLGVDDAAQSEADAADAADAADEERFDAADSDEERVAISRRVLERVRARRLQRGKRGGRFYLNAQGERIYPDDDESAAGARVQQPLLSAAGRAAYLEKHKVALRNAKTPEERAAAQQALSDARAHAGRQYNPHVIDSRLKEHQDRIQSYRSSSDDRAREHEEEAYLPLLQQARPSAVSAEITNLYADATSTRALAARYHKEHEETKRIAPEDSPREQHAYTKSQVSDWLSEQTDQMQQRLADYAPGLPSSERRAVVKRAAAEARERLKDLHASFRKAAQ